MMMAGVANRDLCVHVIRELVPLCGVWCNDVPERATARRAGEHVVREPPADDSARRERNFNIFKVRLGSAGRALSPEGAT